MTLSWHHDVITLFLLRERGKAYRRECPTCDWKRREGKGDVEHRPKDEKWIHKPIFILRLNKWSGLCINISYIWCNKQWMHWRYWIDAGKKYKTSDNIKAWYKGSVSLWYTGKGFFKRGNKAVTCIVWNSAEINWKKINLFRHQRIQQ